MELGEQQVTRHGIGQHHANEEQTRADKGEDHVAGRGDQRASVLLGREEDAGADGADLDKHVARENIVGVAKSQQGDQRHIHVDPVHLTVILHIRHNVPHAAQYGAEHHHGEQGRHQRLHNARHDLVTPRGGIMTHHVGIAHVIGGAEPQHAGVQCHGDHKQANAQPPTPLVACHEGTYSAEKAENDGKEGEVLHEAHTRPPFRFSDIMRYSASISSVWYSR